MTKSGGGGINSMGWRQKYPVMLLHLLVHGLVLGKQEMHKQPLVKEDEYSITCSISHGDTGPLHIQTFDLSAGTLLHSFPKPVSLLHKSHCGDKGQIYRTLMNTDYSEHFFLTTGGEGLGEAQNKPKNSNLLSLVTYYQS